jgi:hypothetical protein
VTFYATFSTDTPSPSRWSRARSAATKRGMSVHPLQAPEALHSFEDTGCHPAKPSSARRATASTFRYTWRVRLSRPFVPTRVPRARAIGVWEIQQRGTDRLREPSSGGSFTERRVYLGLVTTRITMSGDGTAASIFQQSGEHP